MSHEERQRLAKLPLDDPFWDLHHAAYYGRVDVVERLLDAGADPNGHHPPEHTGWFCGPTPLSKAIIAWGVTEGHVAVVELLLAHGARVEDKHFSDWNADSVAGPLDQQILALLETHRPPRP